MNRRGALTIAAIASVAIMSGCYESTGVTVHEQGEYKGSKDPLLDAKSPAERAAVLQKRFQMVQVDR